MIIMTHVLYQILKGMDTPLREITGNYMPPFTLGTTLKVKTLLVLYQLLRGRDIKLSEITHFTYLPPFAWGLLLNERICCLWEQIVFL